MERGSAEIQEKEEEQKLSALLFCDNHLMKTDTSLDIATVYLIS